MATGAFAGHPRFGHAVRPAFLVREISDRMRQRTGDQARDEYLRVIRDLAIGLGAQTMLELGAGRSPSFSEAEIAQMGVRYVCNDICPNELALAPSYVDTEQFDLGSPAPVDSSGQYDLVFSRMLMEHVRDYRACYRNIHALLRHGGVGVAFHPVLSSLPFVMNRLMPEWASRPILRLVDPERSPSTDPKFPAYYSGCLVSPRVRARIRALGFRQVDQIPFYGHNYYLRIPVLREIHAALSAMKAKADFPWAASYAYTIVLK